ncbi:MAG: glycosyltransferase family 2 protein [Cyanobacteria bacterium J06639_14]
MVECSDISIIVPVYNGGEAFKQCLESLRPAQADGCEIIVVADGDTDGSRELAQNFGAIVHQFPQPGGPARARNAGAQIAQGQILFFVDADVVVHPDTVSKVMQAFAADPDLAALMGSYDDQPQAANFLSQYRNLLHHYTHQVANQEANTFWGACGAIRKAIFWQVDGFSEAYRRPMIEDIELGYRLKAAGYKLALYRDIQVKHLKRWEVQSMIKTDFFSRALPWTELLLQRRHLDNDLNLKISARLSVVASYGFLLMSMLALVGLFVSFSLFAMTAVLALICAALVMALNLPLYCFFNRARGFGFMLRCLPWHWFYFLYSGLAFGIGNFKFWYGSWSQANPNEA